MRFEQWSLQVVKVPPFVGNVIVTSVVKVFLVNGTSASDYPTPRFRVLVVSFDGFMVFVLSVYVIDTANPFSHCIASVYAFRLMFLVEP